MEKLSEKVYFSVDTAWFCQLQRDRFWLEHVELDRVIDALKCLTESTGLSEDEQYDIIIQILEGRKIVRGINTGYLEDDNELIRPMSMYYRRLEKEIRDLKLKEDLNAHPYIYVDTYCGGFSMRRFSSIEYPSGSIHESTLSREDIISWRLYGCLKNETPRCSEDDILDKYLLNGVYLLDDPDWACTVLDGVCRDKDEAMKRVTTYFEGRLSKCFSDGETYKTLSDYEKKMYERNQMYYSVNKGHEIPYIIQKELDRENEDINRERKIEDFVFNYELDNYTKKKELETAEAIERESDPIKQKLMKLWGVDRWYIGYIKPDDDQNNYYNSLAWIDTEGNYYSTTFGGHATKASYIVKGLLKEDGKVAEKFEEFEIENELKEYKYSDSFAQMEDFLIHLGWCRLHNPNGGVPYPTSKNGLNRLQRIAIIKAANQFRFDTDPLTGKKLRWEVEEL